MDRRTFVAASLAAGTGVSATAQAASSGPVTILGICCSPRKGKTTFQSMQVCLAEAAKVDTRIKTELLELAGMKIDGAPAAGLPSAFGEEDEFPKIQEKLTRPDVAGVILGTPTYFGNMSYLATILIDRCIAVRSSFGLAGKVAGVLAVGAARNGGQELVIASVQAALMAQEMIVVGDSRPTGHRGATVWSGIKDGVMADEWGLSTAKNLGRHVAQVALQVSSAK
ncbi:MAG: flavodoxin family protein [Sedimentisphaerales bacterium]|nr:flavodoxin family protein [Sedimentisphaerales bacterium]